MQVWYCLVHLNSRAIWQTELFALSISFGMTVALVSIWYSLCSLWVSPLCIQPQVHSSYELSSGRLGYKSYICSIHLCSFWGTSQSIQSVPVNKPSELWSCRKVTQVNYQIIFGQPHDTTWLWRTYSAVGRNKLAQISLKLDLMGHRDRSLSQGTWDCCCCFITYAETCAFVKLPLVSCSSSTPDFHSSYQGMNRADFVSHDGWVCTVCKAQAIDHHSLPFPPQVPSALRVWPYFPTVNNTF